VIWPQDSLTQFVNEERRYYAGQDDNLFVTAFSQATRYRDFIAVIVERYDAARAQFIASIGELRGEFEGSPGGTVSSTQLEMLLRNARLGMLVHLEIETFYLFAKILLDKLALFVEFYFGPVRSAPLTSHDKLAKNWGNYSLAKNLTVQPQFATSVDCLKTRVCDYRDKQVSHLKGPRVLKATLFDGAGSTKIATTHLYPRDGDDQVESQDIMELASHLSGYVGAIVDLVKENRCKTRLRLSEPQGSGLTSALHPDAD
jgi:hypothetical protein